MTRDDIRDWLELLAIGVLIYSVLTITNHLFPYGL